jgi:hypothetical protein
MEVMVAVRSGTLLRASTVQLKRRVSARRGGDYNEVPQAIQKKSRPSPSNCVTPSARKLLSEQGFGFRKASVVVCLVFASHFPSDEVQNEAEIRGSTPVSANDWGENTAAAAVLIEFALNWAPLIFLRAMQLKVELLSAIVVLFVDSFLPFLQSGPGNSRGVVIVRRVYLFLTGRCKKQVDYGTTAQQLQACYPSSQEGHRG